MRSMASIKTLLFLSMGSIIDKKIEVHFLLLHILLGVLGITFGVVAFVDFILLTLIGVVNFIDFMRLMIRKRCGGWLGSQLGNNHKNWSHFMDAPPNSYLDWIHFEVDPSSLHKQKTFRIVLTSLTKYVNVHLVFLEVHKCHLPLPTYLSHSLEHWCSSPLQTYQ